MILLPLAQIWSLGSRHPPKKWLLLIFLRSEKRTGEDLVLFELSLLLTAKVAMQVFGVCLTVVV